MYIEENKPMTLTPMYTEDSKQMTFTTIYIPQP